MIVLALLLLSAASNPMHRADFQEMTGPAFQHFGQIADKNCPSRKLRNLYPPDLYDLADSFENELSTHTRERVASFDKGWAGCPPAGASCPAQNKLDAIAKANLLHSFTHFACASGD
jgi:hypothetical protein